MLAEASKGSPRTIKSDLGLGDRVALDTTDFERLASGKAFIENRAEEPKMDIEDMPLAFRALVPQRPNTKMFFRYLEKTRGFGSDTEDVIKKYDLRGCLLGDFKYRLIIPVYFEGNLVAYTGRAIGDAKLRYRSKATKDGKVASVKNYIWNYDAAIEGGDILIVTEGPFDAIKADYYGRTLDTHAVCIFNTSVSPEQQAYLRDLARNYSLVVFMFDAQFFAEAADAAMAFPKAGASMVVAEAFEDLVDAEEGDDFGALSQEAVVKVLEDLWDVYFVS